MSCAAVIAGLGFECRDVGNNILEVDTSFSFADGSVIGFYVRQTSEGLVISDNADTLAHLASRGIIFKAGKNMRPLHDIASRFGMAINRRGEFEMHANGPATESSIARYISAMIEVAHYERERAGISSEIISFSDEVGLYLRAWKNQSTVTTKPKAKGLSGIPHEFDFQVDSMLVDCIGAGARTTGSLLRKAADVGALESPPPILAILDDRKDSEIENRENKILSSTGMLQVLTMSRLMENAGGSATHQ